MPAIYDLANRGLLPPGFALVGFARRDWADQDFARSSTTRSRSTPAPRSARRSGSSSPRASASSRASFDDDEAFDQLRRDHRRSSTRAAAPAATTRSTCPSRRSSSRRCVKQLTRSGLAEPHGRRPWRRVVIEKPFGHDLASAQELNEIVDEVFPTGVGLPHRPLPRQGDGPEHPGAALRQPAVRADLERHYVDHVQITMAEDIGIGGRAGYYDGIGAARDVIQNHLLQLLALTAMEEPVSFDADDAARREDQGALGAIRLPQPTWPSTTARGQYAAGWQGGEQVRRATWRRRASRPELDDRDLRRDQAARSTPAAGPACRSTCAPASGWAAGSPRSPWCSSGRRTCRSTPTDDRGARPERAGHPGAARRGRHDAVRLEGARARQMEVRDVNMDFAYGESFTESSPEAYERLILDVLLGEPPLFPRNEEVELSWQILDPVDGALGARQGKPEPYPAGTLGAASRRTRCSPAPAGTGGGREPLRCGTDPPEGTRGDRRPALEHHFGGQQEARRPARERRRARARAGC